MLTREWFKADEIATDDFGWSANLAIFRVVFLAVAVLPFAYHVLRWTALQMPYLPAEAWVPISFYRHIPYYVLTNAELAHAMALSDLCLIAVALLGFFTRTALGLATLLSLYLFGLPENLGKVSHFHHIVWFMALLASGPSGEMLSIDAVVSAIRRADRGEVALQVSGRSALATLRYAWIMIGLLYLGSGLAKLKRAWLHHWISADNFRHIIWGNWFERRMYTPGFALPIRVDKLSPVLLDMAGAGVIALETGFLALVLFRWLRWFLIPAGIAFHAGNGVVLGIWFTSLMGGYVCLVDWTWLGRFAMRITGQQRLLVIYDGSCELCRRTVAILKTLDICGTLVPMAGSSRDPRRLAHPEITDEMLLRDLYVVGRNYVAGGYEGYKKMATSLLVLWPLALIMKFPPVAAVGRRIYRVVADSRHCPIDQASPSLSAPGSKGNVWLAPHVVGIFLMLGELTFSARSFPLSLRTAQLPTALRPSAHVALHIARRWRGSPLFWPLFDLYPWPFDLYPTYTTPADAFYRCWEVRLVSSDGSEASVPPEVFASALGDGITSGDIMSRVLGDPAPARRYALAVARMLWSRLPESSRLATVTLRGYRSVYSTDPDDVHLVRRTLTDNFPARLLAPGGNTLHLSGRNQDLGRPMVEVRP